MPDYRYFTVGGTLYQATENNRRRALEFAKRAQSTNVILDLSDFRIVPVSTHPVEDWSHMTSAMAEALLAQMGPETAEEVAEMQEAIENDAPLVDVSKENQPSTPQKV